MGQNGGSWAGAPGRVVIAGGEEDTETAAALLRSEADIEIVSYDRRYGLAPFIEQVRPDVLLLDMDLPRVDTLNWIRGLEPRSGAAPLEVLLLCPATCDKARLADYARAGVRAIVIRPFTRETLVPKVMEAVGKARAARKHAEPPSAAATADAARPTKAGVREALPAAAGGRRRPRPVAGNRSLLEADTACAFHAQPSVFPGYTLRTNKVITDLSFFDIPVYVSAIPGADFVNFHLLNVMTCPDCFFSSNNAEYFIHPGNEKSRTHPFAPPVREAVMALADERRKLAVGLSSGYFSEKRTPQDAVCSYKLAIESSRALWDANNREYAVELVRMANYELRIAQIRETMDLPAPEGEDPYSTAFDLLKLAFRYVAGVQVYRAIYQLVAIAIRLGRDTDCAKYVDHIRMLEREASVPDEDRSTLQRYVNRVRKAWADRDFHRAPSAPSPPAAPPNGAGATG
ncbi:MAG: DUF2225 domain-containing protein [Phycisphaerae bacterium]|nr:DUF2225 domain-containing protein [Phycisphaerae bacterium]